MQEIRDMENEAERRRYVIEMETKQANEDLERAIERRVAAGNAEAVEALRRLVAWVPECGFPTNIRPMYLEPSASEGAEIEYRRTQHLNDRDIPFASEAYTYELWGKEDARTYLALLGTLARALGFKGGLHDLDAPVCAGTDVEDRDG